MSKHTPGPWTYEHLDKRTFCLTGADGTKIVDGCGCCDSPWISGDADARLIAAAPELLDALVLLVAGVENSCSDTFIPLAKAKAAIAKAEGRS